MSERTRSDRHGPAFWAGVVLGWPLIGFGLLVLFQRAGATRPPNFALFFLGSLLAHDFVLAPTTLVVAAVAGRRLPPRIRGPLVGAAAVSGVIALASLPVVLRFGRLASNPSLLPRNGVLGLLLVLLVVWIWAATLAALAVRRFRDSGAVSRNDPASVEGPGS